MTNKEIKKWINKIDIRKIIKEHLDTLYYKEKGEEVKSYQDRILFFGIPLLISLLIVILTKTISTETSTSLMTLFAIFIPAMFTLLPVIYSLIQKKFSKHGYKLINQFKANVFFLILISITTLVFLLLNSIDLGDSLISTDYSVIWYYYNWSISFIIYYLLGVVILTLLMILQRFNFLINEFIKIQLKNKNA